ncbi:MAG: 50S ribosomal protein L6 [Desulfonatronovibrionaceae bacterium]
MSRIGKLPVQIPDKVEVNISESSVDVNGPKGSLTVPGHPSINFVREENTVKVVPVDNSITAREQYGLRRTLLNNAVQGVNTGFSRTLEVVGVGYKVAVKGDTVELNVGYSHPVNFKLPQGVEASAEGNKLTLSGVDKQVVGETAAKIRRVRAPEPYKGKGIKYLDEEVKRKAGKSGSK